ncbi:hypothetical protein XENOCAPTIV_020887, partial [Xenoophorus captivus]
IENVCFLFERCMQPERVGRTFWRFQTIANTSSDVTTVMQQEGASLNAQQMMNILKNIFWTPSVLTRPEPLPCTYESRMVLYLVSIYSS